MGSNFHFTIDLNEDQNHQPFLSPLGSSLHHLHHQPPYSYFPISPNAHFDQVPINNNAFAGFLDPHLSQTLETKKFVCNGGSSASDQMVSKKETRLKLTIRKKDNHHHDQFDQYQRKEDTETNSFKWISSKVRLMKKKKKKKKKKTLISTTDNNKQHVGNEQSLNLSNIEGYNHDYLKKLSPNQFNVIVNDNGYNGSNNCEIRICSDCNTTKTPLWRSGPRGPKSLCNACGIRQRKARRAAMAATLNSDLSPPLLKKKKMQNKNKRSNRVCNLSSPSAPKVKKCKRIIRMEEETVMEAEPAGVWETHSKSTMSSSSSTISSSNKFDFDDLAIILSKSSAYQQVFPQDEKEAAVLLMALSYGMVHG